MEYLANKLSDKYSKSTKPQNEFISNYQLKC